MENILCYVLHSFIEIESPKGGIDALFLRDIKSGKIIGRTGHSVLTAPEISKDQALPAVKCCEAA